MKNNVIKLFVYGSLRSGFKHPAYEYISRYFMLIGAAKVKGKLYDMGSYPAAIPTQENFFILGELYELKYEKEFDWAFEQLDDYEGVHPENNEQSLYIRQQATVFVNGETTTAWMYWYNAPIYDQPLISSGDVIEFIQHKSKL
ncbi:MAG: gamma-glutamylcyclotransferase [Chitinophagaceae bacterium]|nr:gamma-glutamylcyclotransferase [Chitinophagaceae bacterium]